LDLVGLVEIPEQTAVTLFFQQLPHWAVAAAQAALVVLADQVAAQAGK
jgi:hypothetical protein